MRSQLPDDVDEIIRLVEVVPFRGLPVHGLPALAGAVPVWRSRKLLLRFLLIVALPTLVAITYFDLVASDRYVSEAKFLVRNAQSLVPRPQQKVGLDEAASTFAATDDSYVVHDFILSRDAMRLLVDKAGLREVLAHGGVDPFWKFPGLMTGSTDEDLYRLYLAMVSTSYDSTSGLTTLRVQAFTAADAKHIGNTLINGAEALMDRLNERARANAIQDAQTEIAKAREQAMRAIDDLTAFRNRESVIDPTIQSKSVLDVITTLSLRLAEASAQLDVISRSSPGNPQLPLLRARIEALQNQINRERATLAGTDRSFAPRIADYERLVLEQDFAEKRLTSALGVLEVAQQAAERQEIYLERVVEPHAADKADYPRRFAWPLCVLLASLAAFWIFRPEIEPRRRPS